MPRRKNLQYNVTFLKAQNLDALCKDYVDQFTKT